MDEAVYIAWYNLHLFGEITYKFNAADSHTVLVADRLTVSYSHIAKKVVLSLQQNIIGILPRNKFLLSEQAFDFIEDNLSLHMAGNYMNMLIWAKSLYINAGDSNSLEFFVR